MLLVFDSVFNWSMLTAASGRLLLWIGASGLCVVIPSSQDWEHGDVSRSEKLMVWEQDKSTELKKHKCGHFQTWRTQLRHLWEAEEAFLTYGSQDGFLLHRKGLGAGDRAQVVGLGFYPKQYINSVWWGLPAILAFWEGEERDFRVQGRPWLHRSSRLTWTVKDPFNKGMGGITVK